MDPSTMAMAAAPNSVTDSALFTVIQDATTQRWRLQRLGGVGCALSPLIDFNYQDVTVSDGLLSPGNNNVFVSRGSEVQQVNHRRCGETTAGPFRWVGRLATSPSEQRLALSNCGSWLGMQLDQGTMTWVFDDALTRTLRSLSGLDSAVLLDDALVAGVSVDGALTFAASHTGLSTTFDVKMAGASPRPDSLARCGHGAVCLAYPDAGFAARWSDQGELLDVVRVDGLKPEEQVVRLEREFDGTGFYLLLSGPQGASLAYGP